MTSPCTGKTFTTCPVCGATAHACGEGRIYCGDANVTMTPSTIAEALAARDIAHAIIDGATLHQALAAQARRAEL